MKDVKALGDQLVNLSVKEVKELAEYLKETYGIEQSVAAPIYHPPGDGDYVPAEKSNFDIVLKSAGANKLQIVKLVKDLLNIGLKESKDLVDGAPKVISEGVSKENAENIKNQLLNAGAEVELR